MQMRQKAKLFRASRHFASVLRDYTAALVAFRRDPRVVNKLISQETRYRVANHFLSLHAGKVLAGIFGLFFVMAVAAAYEIIEWQYAVIVGGNDANDFLGSQGDIWDAQKDMFCDTCGAVASLILFYLVRPWRRKGAETASSPG